MCMYIYIHTYIYICTYIYGLRGTEWIWFYGWLLRPGAPSPSCTSTRIQLRASLTDLCFSRIVHTPTRSRQAHGQAARSSTGCPIPIPVRRGVGPIHRGTEPRAINLFARQPATRHCVYPHVNHYVRPRDVEPTPYRALRFAANS